jgi:hypothetical protein
MWWFENRNSIAYGKFCVHFPHMMGEAKQKGQYEDETLIGWNNLCVIGQSVKRVYVKKTPYWPKC